MVRTLQSDQQIFCGTLQEVSEGMSHLQALVEQVQFDVSQLRSEVRDRLDPEFNKHRLKKDSPVESFQMYSDGEDEAHPEG